VKQKNVALEFIHKDSYGIALEVAKKFVNKNEMRPILNYVFHAANGDMIATDSHRLIHIKQMHGFGQDYLVHPTSFMVAKGKYPDTGKLSVVTENHKGLIVLTKEQIKLWLQLFKSINQTLAVLKDRNKIVRIIFTESSNTVDVELGRHGIKMSLPCGRPITTDHEPISFNAEYMRDALEVHFKLNSEQLTFWFAGPMRPFISDDDAFARTILLPVRTY
jgi:DNA polymerase III sliding clamp (beta) subunit (PCNA family)